MSRFTIRLDGYQADPMMLHPLAMKLRFKKTERGGYASINFDLKRPLNAKDLEPYSHVTIYSAEKGSTACAGRLLNPGKGEDASGEIWEIAAIGEGLAATTEREQPYVMFDQQDDRWHQAFQSSKNAEWSVSDVPSGSVAGLLIKLGQSIASGKRSDVRYYDLHESEQFLAAFKGEFDSGRTDSGNRLVAYASNFGTGGFIIINGATGQGFDTTTLKTFDAYVGTDFTYPTDGIDNAFIRYERTGATFTAVESDWAHLRNMAVQAMRYGRDGQLITTDAGGIYSAWSLDATQLIVDVLARFCPTLDVATAVINADNSPIEQAAWFDGISPAGVFDWLLSLNGYTSYTWGAFERQPNGLFRFEWRPLPAYGDVRYVATQPVEYRRTGNDDGTYNEYWVMGNNSKGRPVASKQSFLFDAELLAAGGKRRSKLLRLSDTSNFSADAAELAGAAYEDDRYSAKAARLVIAGPVLDTYTGKYVDPDEVDPGYNVRLPGVGTKADTLNLYETAGGAVTRIVSVDYSEDDGVAVCELNAQTFNMQQAIAGLLQAQAR